MLDTPNGVAVDRVTGTLYIADTWNNRIRKVNPQGIISTFAGSAAGPGFAGDGGQATAAQLNAPVGVAFEAGALYIADTNNNRVRKVDAAGVITTVAGTGNPGFAGDNGAAVAGGWVRFSGGGNS